MPPEQCLPHPAVAGGRRRRGGGQLHSAAAAPGADSAPGEAGALQFLGGQAGPLQLVGGQAGPLQLVGRQAGSLQVKRVLPLTNPSGRIRVGVTYF